MRLGRRSSRDSIRTRCGFMTCPHNGCAWMRLRLSPRATGLRRACCRLAPARISARTCPRSRSTSRSWLRGGCRGARRGGGNGAAEPWSVPEIRRGQTRRHRSGLTFSGAAKLAALAPRAFVAESRDYYLCPLPATQVSPAELERVLAPVWEPHRRLLPGCRPAEPGASEPEPALSAAGCEVSGELKAVLAGRVVQWVERRWSGRAVAWAEAPPRARETRLERARPAVATLNERRQGKKRYLDAAAVRAAGEQILAPPRVHAERTLEIAARGDAAAEAQAKRRLGWRVYATKQSAAELSLAQAVLADREEYLVERGCGRLTGNPLSLAPLYRDTAARVPGLRRVLVSALRVVCLLEFCGRRHLQAEGEKRAGLYPGNPKRATARPTTDLRLRAFDGLTLTLLTQESAGRAHLTPLSEVQQRILQLLGLPPEVYLRLAQPSSKPLLKMSEL